VIQRIEQRKVWFMGFLVECPGCGFYYPEHEHHEEHKNLCEPCGNEVVDIECREARVEVHQD
jgi:rRNA maturation endonuclease Nob1